ncbi:MAG: hypothetical protein D6753_01895 [Planctomycetota bacterium]|nr:MAG: hypothetical protein D6753_01895 [Planctomycetota bacterium]
MNEVMERPVLHDDLAAGEDIPPLSRMAVLTLVLGVISLVAILTSVMLPICVITIGLGAATLWHTMRDPAVRGTGLAQAGLGLGVLSAAWSLSALHGEQKHLYEVAGQHAAEFLDVLASGQKYQALELMRKEPDRQITGTDLQQYYENADFEIKDFAEGFLSGDATKWVIEQGPDAQWEFVRGIQIKKIRSNAEITVEMRNKLAEPPRDRIWVTLQRNLNLLLADDDGPTALWHVAEISFPKDTP